MKNTRRIVYLKDDIRGRALHQIAQRLDIVENGPSININLEPARAIQHLHQRGCIIGRGDDILYAPSWHVRQKIFEMLPAGAWGEKIIKKQKGVFRSSSGAIVRLPIEGCNEVVETFITDWSPFPAAAAVAIHSLHPLACGNIDADYFTGKFVRHPLTGDLLPLWVTSWVRPDFGTGAVVVNPAHSDVDLNFARKIGLPIRFALSEGTISCDPVTWPDAPVIKKGVTTKTGRFDGLDVDCAIKSYFEEMSTNGWAYFHTDRALGTIKIATVNGSPEPVLDAVLRANGSEHFELFWPASEVEESLLFARLLHLELFERPLEPAVLRLWQRADPPKVEDSNEICLASLATGPIDQVATIKAQTVDQCCRFGETHNRLILCSLEGQMLPRLSAIKRDLLDGDFNSAFSKLYNVQKQSVKNNNEGLPDYFALTYVLAGLPAPSMLDLNQLWNSLT